VALSESIISCDEKYHIRHGKNDVFHGLLGVTLGVRDVKDFRRKYDAILDSFFKNVSMYRKKKVYKSSEIGSLFPGRRDKVLAAYRLLARALLKIPNVNINVYYLTLNLKLLRQRAEALKATEEKEENEETESSEDQVEPASKAKIITIYGERGREGAREISVSEFFKRVKEYFPIVCAWKLCSSLNLWQVEIVLDGCKGERSHAWDELVSRCRKVTIAFGGDLYNPFVSSADLLAKWIDEELRESGMPLNQSALTRVLTEWKGVTDDIATKHIHWVHLGNRDLKDIQPLSKEKIDVFENLYARHPIFFIFREEGNSVERLEIESSPMMNKIHDLIYAKDGSLLWWDPNIHAKVIAQDDVAIVFGEKGMREAKHLNKLGYQLRIQKAEDIGKKPKGNN
jgi:hypothetical protein